MSDKGTNIINILVFLSKKNIINRLGLMVAYQHEPEGV